MTNTPLPGNRRIAARVALRAPATVKLPNGQQRDVQLSDLAIDGASLLSARPIPQGSTLELHAVLPGSGEAIVAPARVIYSSYQAAGEFRVGLSFSRLDDTSAAAITAFIA